MIPESEGGVSNMKRCLIVVLAVLFTAIGASAVLAEQHVSAAQASPAGKAVYVENVHYWDNKNNALYSSKKEDGLWTDMWSGDNYWNPSYYDYYHPSPSSPSHPSYYHNSRPLYDSYNYSPSLSHSTYNTYHNY